MQCPELPKSIQLMHVFPFSADGQMLRSDIRRQKLCYLLMLTFLHTQYHHTYNLQLAGKNCFGRCETH